jgi:prepilin-type N-terminal cleavage/methylation domain-containing protein
MSKVIDSIINPKIEFKYEVSGFSLVEVLVSLIILSIFIGLSMQAFMVAVILKARAEQKDEATNWVQEDLELVKYQAKEYEKNAYPYSAKCNATNTTNGLAASFLNDSVAGLGGASQTIGPKTFGGVPFVMTRTASYADSVDPFKLLQITYQVKSQTNGNNILTISTETIIDAALKCP